MRRSLISTTPCCCTRYRQKEAPCLSPLFRDQTQKSCLLHDTQQILGERSHSPHRPCLHWRQKQGERTETPSARTSSGLCRSYSTQIKSHCCAVTNRVGLYETKKQTDSDRRENFAPMNRTFQGHSAAWAGTCLHAGMYTRKERGKISVTQVELWDCIVFMCC